MEAALTATLPASPDDDDRTRLTTTTRRTKLRPPGLDQHRLGLARERWFLLQHLRPVAWVSMFDTDLQELDSLSARQKALLRRGSSQPRSPPPPGATVFSLASLMPPCASS
jgi:hypothetical protein